MNWMVPFLVAGGSLAVGWAGWILMTLLHSRVPLVPVDPKGPVVNLDPLGFPRVMVFCRTLWAGRAKKRTLTKLREIFPQTLGMAVQALRAGQTVPQTLFYLSQEGLQPLRGEFSQVCSEMGLGASADMALSNLAARYQEAPELSRLLESYRLSRTTGANLGQLFQTLLEGLEEKNRLARKTEAMTAQARLSGTLMGLLPVILAAVLSWMDPGLMLPLFTEKAGWAVLSLAIFLEGVGFIWIRHLLQPGT